MVHLTTNPLNEIKGKTTWNQPQLTKHSSDDVYINYCSVRVANELGAGNGKGARFATIVSVTQSLIIGLFFWVIIMLLHSQIAWIFSSSEAVLAAVNKLSILLAFTILLNSVQPVLSGTSHYLSILYITISLCRVNVFCVVDVLALE